jgi:hypothetical protein
MGGEKVGEKRKNEETMEHFRPQFRLFICSTAEELIWNECKDNVCTTYYIDSLSILTFYL